MTFQPCRHTVYRVAAPVIAVALLALVSCSDDVPRLAKLEPGARILAFGDSLTRGTGANAGEDYPSVLQTLSGREVVNAGVPGEISADGRSRLAALLDRVRPQLLILCHGGNDMLRKLATAQTAANLRAMIAMARERGIAVVLIGVPRPGIFLSTAQMYAQIADTEHVPFDGESLAHILGNAGLKADPVHPNAAGYRVLAERAYQLLRDAGAL
ncbi:MAG: arylesterase [Gammaproteobacteria bacterium]|nr:arylesterase [Gammaproteobacteria bacterium]